MRFLGRLACLLLMLCAAASEARGQTVYLAFGDSITEGVGDDPTLTAKGYPPRLEGLLAEAGVQATVRNAGLASEDTTEALSRIGGVLRQGADVLLLMEGTNDVGPGISDETTRFNLEELAQKALVRNISVIHATVIPRIPTAAKDSNNLLTQRMNEEIRDLAGTEGRALADPFEVFGSTPDLFTDFYDDDPDDAVGHPNSDGYDLLARVFADVILDRDTVPPVTGRLDPANGATRVPVDHTLKVDIWDFGDGIDLANTSLLVNGTAVTATQSGDSAHATLTYTPTTPFVGRVFIGLQSRDLASPVNSVNRTVASFLVAGTVFLDGDLNQDGRVDGADLVIFARAFGSRRGETRYLLAADFDGDRTIDGTDLAVLANNFGDSTF